MRVITGHTATQITFPLADGSSFVAAKVTWALRHCRVVIFKTYVPNHVYVTAPPISKLHRILVARSISMRCGTNGLPVLLAWVPVRLMLLQDLNNRRRLGDAEFDIALEA